MEKLTKLEIRNEIEQYFPAVIKAADESRKWKALLEDYCSIGSLLTDQDACYSHLQTLNNEMASELRQQLDKHGIEKRNEKWKDVPISQFGQLDSVRISELVKTGKEEDNLDVSLLPKFYGILQRVLLREENRFGFNGKKVELPQDLQGIAKVGKTPLLTGFFHPESFSDVLLKQGFHWKDPGAGIEHGESSHRIQWYIIQQASFTGDYKTQLPVLSIFQSLALPTCQGENVWVDSKVSPQFIQKNLVRDGVEFQKRTMWDLLLDCITTGSKQYGPRSNTFRCPEILNSALKNKGEDDFVKRKLPVLSNYIRARNTKLAYYETRNRMNDQFIALQIAINNLPQGSVTFDQYPGKQKGPADGRAVWK